MRYLAGLYAFSQGVTLTIANNNTVWALNNANDAKNWPEGGELDIIEGQNDAQRNLFAAHT